MLSPSEDARVHRIVDVQLNPQASHADVVDAIRLLEELIGEASKPAVADIWRRKVRDEFWPRYLAGCEALYAVMHLDPLIDPGNFIGTPWYIDQPV